MSSKSSIRFILVVSLFMGSGWVPKLALASSALPLHITVLDNPQQPITPAQRRVVDLAIRLVKTRPPKHLPNHIFDWQGNRQILAGKQVRLVFMHIPEEGFPRDTGMMLTSSSLNVDQPTGEIVISIFVFVDRNLYFPNGQTKPHGLMSTMISLAYELYGTLQWYLHLSNAELRLLIAEDDLHQQRMALETHKEGLQASLWFLDAIQQELASTRLYVHELLSPDSWKYMEDQRAYRRSRLAEIVIQELRSKACLN